MQTVIETAIAFCKLNNIICYDENIESKNKLYWLMENKIRM